MKKFLALALFPIILLVGCKAQTAAQKAEMAIGAVLAVAQAEVPLLPVADQAPANAYVAVAGVLNSQLQSCIGAVGSMSLSKSAKFVACFNTFAQGLGSQAELAQLRILSPDAQKKFQTYIAIAIAGVNAAESYFGGKQQVVPAVSAPAMSYLATPEGQLEYEILYERIQEQVGE